ncbi:PhnD/SsuA/transferrin family substrate-binding protein [Natronococcus occultus]|uniref:PhnD/SsuA/transferrin family substrate-binding protein n=1 Tax=Natronococcus occultus TaxID=29288 RepID=UPI0009FEA037
MQPALDSDTIGISRRAVLTTATGVTAAGLAGCLGNNDGSEGQGDDDDHDNPDVSDEVVFAIEAQDGPADIERDWEPLAEWIESETGVPTSIDTVPDDSAAIGALATGQAHASYLSGGPSWVGWNEHGFERSQLRPTRMGSRITLRRPTPALTPASKRCAMPKVLTAPTREI